MRFQPICVLSLLALVGGSAVAQDPAATGGLLDRIRDTDRAMPTSQQTLTGTWMMELRGPGTRPNRPLLVTFHDSGTATASSSNGAESAHAGVWVRVGDRKFLQTMYMFVYNEQRVLAAINKVRITAQIDDRGTTVHGKAEIVVTDAAGNVMATIGGVEYTGVRLTVERSADVEDFLRDDRKD